MKLRLLGLFGLLAVGLAGAQSNDVSVRLYWIRSPAELRLAGRAGETRLTVCSPCGELPWVGPIKVKAVGDRLQVEGRDALAESLELNGVFRLEVPGSASLSLSSPLEIRAAGGRLQLTLRLPLEEYVAGVLAGESSDFRSEESLKAMAVAARTYAARFRGRHQAEGFDFCDTTHCQDFRGSARTPRLAEAVNATEGELLWHAGEPAAAFYHRNCGGTAEAGSFLAPYLRAPYLRQQRDTFCVARGRGEWSSEIRKEELQRALAAAGVEAPVPLGSVAVLSRTPSGRVERLRLGGAASHTLTASAFRLAVGRALGWDRIRSDFYDIREAGERLVFHGYGSGHGVGLCQVGAAEMGMEGKSYREILAYYYPGTALGLTAQGLSWQALRGERIELLSTQPNEDREVLALTERLIRELEESSGWSYSLRPQLKVYPSVATFRNATGSPGWVAASSRGRVVRLQPTSVLRSVGTLERTLRHELTHLLVESRIYPGAPLWFREGLVAYLAEGSRPSQPPGALADAGALEEALRRPRSQEELRRAHEAARARVQNLIETHGRSSVLEWVERGLPAELVAPRRPSQPSEQRR